MAELDLVTANTVFASQSLTYKRLTRSFVDMGRCISSGLRGGGYCLIAWNVSRPDGTEDGVTRQLDSLSM